MRGVQISELDLGTDGGITVKSLATIFADGEVVGASYLASNLRKSVEARGPMALESVVRLYNNGYYGASWLDKGRVYLKEGQEAPAGMQVTEGPRGGRYYETSAGRGRPLGDAPKDWKPVVGERVRFRWPGDRLNGRLGRITEISEGFAQVEGIDWQGGARVGLDEGKLTPAPYTAKEKKEMAARDILISEFGATRRYDDYKESGIRMETRDPHTGLAYDVYDTEAGVALWVMSDPDADKPWMVTKESTVSLESFMKALPEMSAEALRAMKDEVQTIIFSPVGNPNDRKLSKSIGSKFTSAASISMKTRIMHIYPKSKGETPQQFADILTHETGHAMDAARQKLVTRYNNKVTAFWKEREDMPADPDRLRAIEEENGIPPHPNAWYEGYGKFREYELATMNPQTTRFWGSYRRRPEDAKLTGRDWMMIGEKSWSELNPDEMRTVQHWARKTAPVSLYAYTNEKEYYAEAYQQYQDGKLKTEHIMFEHFEQLAEIMAWSKWG